MKIVIFLLAIWAVCGEGSDRYDGFKVFRMYPSTQEQRDLLSNLETSHLLDFWTDVNKIGLPVDVMVNPDDQKIFENVMMKNGMNPTVYIDDVQTLIDQQQVGDLKRSRAMTWDKYYTLSDIHSWLNDLENEYPGVVSVVNAGKSYQGRDIQGVKIARGNGEQVVFIECGIHAREWISAATCNWIINEILTGTDPAFQKIANSFEWHIFPSVNPDGYSYTHTNDRLWRKTRTPYGICTGADPNRNWDAHWMEQGSSSSPCSETYAGPQPFSEVETKGLSNYITGISSKLVAYIDFHSYSQLLLLPYGHTSQPLDNYNEMMQIGRKCIEALSRRYGTSYSVGNIAEIIYPASGGSIDWVKQEFKTPISVAFELRDTGRYGFLLPPNQIVPNGEEIIDSLVGLFEEAENFGYVNLG